MIQIRDVMTGNTLVYLISGFDGRSPRGGKLRLMGIMIIKGGESDGTICLRVTISVFSLEELHKWQDGSLWVLYIAVSYMILLRALRI